METFKGMVDKCQMMKDNGTEACSCWSNDNFTALVTTIKFVANYSCVGFYIKSEKFPADTVIARGCKISSDQKLVIAQLSSCKGNFSACKQVKHSLSLSQKHLIHVSGRGRRYEGDVLVLDIKGGLVGLRQNPLSKLRWS